MAVPKEGAAVEQQRLLRLYQSLETLGTDRKRRNPVVKSAKEGECRKSLDQRDVGAEDGGCERGAERNGDDQIEGVHPRQGPLARGSQKEDKSGIGDRADDPETQDVVPSVKEHRALPLAVSELGASEPWPPAETRSDCRTFRPL
jgi:hypothetical protein